MDEQKLWASFLALSNHMWSDEYSRSGHWYSKEVSVGDDAPYMPENHTDLTVWDDTVKALAERRFNAVVIDVGDGLRYDRHPEISAPDAWDKDFLKKKLAELRALGIEPIPKLNFSTCHDTWLKEYRRMISTPKYYEVCRDLIDEVCEVFSQPRYFHLGLDEETMADQGGYEMAIIRGASLWWHDAYFLFDECARHGARPWIWADYFWAHPTQFTEKMPHSTLVSNWFYQDFMDHPQGSFFQKSIAAYEQLDQAGFDQVPTSSTWIRANNSQQTMAHARHVLTDSRLKGFLTVPWRRTQPNYRFILLNDAEQFYLGRKLFYPESF